MRVQTGQTVKEVLPSRGAFNYIYLGTDGNYMTMVVAMS